MVLAFRYVNGGLEPCQNYGRAMMTRPPPPPFRLPPARKLTPRERREKVRSTSGRHRYRARRVPAIGYVFERFARIPSSERFEGHMFQGPTYTDDGARGAGFRLVMLYLPAGEEVSERHRMDLERVLREMR